MQTPSDVRPLGGIQVVSLALNVPGPAAAARLCRLGAAVAKVEPPGGDPLASGCPAWYEELCAGQEVVRLDLKGADGRASLDGLLEGLRFYLANPSERALASTQSLAMASAPGNDCTAPEFERRWWSMFSSRHAAQA